MSTINTDGPISVSQLNLNSFRVVMPDRRRVLSAGMLRASIEVLGKALAQPVPTCQADLMPEVAEASHRTVAYAWRDLDGTLRLDATGFDDPAAALTEQQALLLRLEMSAAILLAEMSEQDAHGEPDGWSQWLVEQGPHAAAVTVS